MGDGRPLPEAKVPTARGPCTAALGRSGVFGSPSALCYTGPWQAGTKRASNTPPGPPAAISCHDCSCCHCRWWGCWWVLVAAPSFFGNRDERLLHSFLSVPPHPPHYVARFTEAWRLKDVADLYHTHGPARQSRESNNLRTARRSSSCKYKGSTNARHKHDPLTHSHTARGHEHASEAGGGRGYNLSPIARLHGTPTPPASQVLAKGISEVRAKERNKRVDSQYVDNFLDSFLKDALIRRLLVANHLAHTEADMHTDGQWQGIFRLDCLPAQSLQDTIATVKDMCVAEFGAAPKFEISGDVDTSFMYIPSHLDFVFMEMLKNSTRYVLPSLPLSPDAHRLGARQQRICSREPSTRPRPDHRLVVLPGGMGSEANIKFVYLKPASNVVLLPQSSFS